jgi:hypothetical protein
MPQVLKLAHLIQQYGVTQVQVGRGRVEAGLDAQRPTAFQSLDQLLALDDFVSAARNRSQRVVKLAHERFS